MNMISGIILAAAVLSGIPAGADDSKHSSLDFHGFERTYVQAGLTGAGYDRVREAVPVGVDVANAVDVLRRAGAHCHSAKPQRSSINCFYSELLSVDDYVNTYSTWDIHLDLAADKVSGVSVERTTQQRS